MINSNCYNKNNNISISLKYKINNLPFYRY